MLKENEKMIQEKYKPGVADVMEVVFDLSYLLFDLIAGILFLRYSKGNSLFILYGILTLNLCGGDAFHLVWFPVSFGRLKDPAKRSKDRWAKDFRSHPSQ